jgi:indolepyruvate ferredoxin oxidoreductase
VGEAGVASFDADTVAGKLLGDSIYVNPMMLGYAWQKGWVPLTRASLMRAIELNGVQVDNNKAAFEWGRRPRTILARRRRWPAGRAAHRAQAARDAGVDRRAPRGVPHRLPERRLRPAVPAFVDRVRQAEGALGKTSLTEAVARYLFKLMAYKDEYEVARLHTDRPSWRASRACSRATTS